MTTCSDSRDYDERVHFLATALRPIELARRVVNAESEIRRLKAIHEKEQAA